MFGWFKKKSTAPSMAPPDYLPTNVGDEADFACRPAEAIYHCVNNGRRSLNEKKYDGAVFWFQRVVDHAERTDRGSDNTPIGFNGLGTALYYLHIHKDATRKLKGGDQNKMVERVYDLFTKAAKMGSANAKDNLANIFNE